MGSRKPGRNGNIKYVDFLRTLKDALTTSIKKQKVTKENQHKQKINDSTHKNAIHRQNGKIQRTASAVTVAKTKAKSITSQIQACARSSSIITVANQSRQERILKRSQEIKSRSKSSTKVKKVTVRMPTAPSVSNRSNRASRRSRSRSKRESCEQIRNEHEHHFFKKSEPDNRQCEESQQKF